MSRSRRRPAGRRRRQGRARGRRRPGVAARRRQRRERGESEAAGHVADAVERLETRVERYDEFVPELRAWGQSPVYAIAWRNRRADPIAQPGARDWLAPPDRERTARLVEDGIRFGGR